MFCTFRERGKGREYRRSGLKRHKKRVATSIRIWDVGGHRAKHLRRNVLKKRNM